MRSVNLFLPLVLPYAPGCSNPMARQAIVSACIEFCARTLVVQNTSQENAVAAESDVDVEEPSEQALVKVLAVYYKDDRLKARSREMVRRGSAAHADGVPGVTPASGAPMEWFARDPALPVVSVYPAPAEAATGVFTIIAAHQPTRTAKKVADTLYDDYAEDIAAGAIARLLVMPAQPFTAPNLAKPYVDQFKSAVFAASALARTGLGATSSRVQPGFFA